jgi:hypothetical protein
MPFVEADPDFLALIVMAGEPAVHADGVEKNSGFISGR